MATLGVVEQNLGENTQQLVYTASASGEYLTFVMYSGMSVGIGWYNNAGTTILGAAVLSVAEPSTKLGPFASGDKIYLFSTKGDAIVTMTSIKV